MLPALSQLLWWTLSEHCLVIFCKGPIHVRFIRLSVYRALQYLEIRDSRIILGINSLFYATCLLPLYVSACHIVLHDVPDDVLRAANLSLVANSTFKLFVYFALSSDFR